MSLGKFVLKSCLIGMCIPCVFMLINLIFTFPLILQEVVIFLWPTSIFMMITDEISRWQAIQVFLFSVGVNVYYYSLIGLILWLGIYKFRLILALVPVLMFYVFQYVPH